MIDSTQSGRSRAFLLLTLLLSSYATSHAQPHVGHSDQARARKLLRQLAAVTGSLPKSGAPLTTGAVSREPAALPPTAYRVKLNIGPLRQFWPEHHGYCGEMSLQQAGAYFGHWISQRAARRLGHGELLLSKREGENLPMVVNSYLGFNASWFRRQPVAEGGLKRYLLWMKQALEAGMPVVMIARLKSGESQPPEAYDHIMPMYGFSSSSLTNVTLNDTFIWTTGMRNEVVRSVGAPGFFAPSPRTCVYNMTEGGCINNNINTYNYGMAIAGLYDAYQTYLPMQLIITGWQDGTPGAEEPRDGDVAGTYALNLTRAGPFAVGDEFTIFRFNMMRGENIDDVISSGDVLANMTSSHDVKQLCTSAQEACRMHTVAVEQPGPQAIADAHEHLGRIRANSVVFFVAVQARVQGGHNDVSASG